MTKTNSKMSHSQMIDHLKRKGVTFNHISEEDALEILKNNNYFFKLKSYKSNFDRDQAKNYKNLDFGTLMDLSVLDSHFRRFVLNASLNIEHFMKARLLQLITDDATEDGYTIIDEFITHYNNKIDQEAISKGEKINKNKHLNIKKLWGHAKDTKNTLTKDLYDSFENAPPIWVIFEIISFTNLVKFAEFYASERKHNINRDLKVAIDNLMYVKFIRNAAAHNNPILRNIRDKKVVGALPSLQQFVDSLEDILPKHKKFLKNDCVHSFVATIYVFDKLISSKPVKDYTYVQLLELLERCERNKHYYEKAPTDFKAIFAFIKTYCEGVVRLNDV